MKISNLLGASALVSTLCLGISGVAFAQDTPTKPATPPADVQPAEKEAASDILVVGSRIRRDTFNSASPVQVITRDETTLAGFASTTAVLQGTGVTGGSSQINNAFGGFVTDGGPGANTLSLRGLGATRTLILLNGRRIAPSGTRGSVGSADLNVLPNAITDRIDVLRDGASSVYGSDAVAGVVNIVTRKKIEGLTLESQYNATGEGGGNAGSISAVLGTTGDRFNVAAAFEYSRRNELTLGDRDWSRCNTDYRINPAIGTPGSGDFIDPRTGLAKCYPITATGSNGVTINTIGTNTRPGVAAAGTTGTNFNRFRPNSAVTTGLVGFEGVSLNSRDTFDPRTLNRQSVSPGEVYNGYIQGGYDIQTLGDAEVYFEFLGNVRNSSQVGYRQLSLDYAVGSPLIPANLSTSVFSGPQTPNLTGTRNIGVRAFIGFGNDKSSQNSKFWKASIGMRGDFLFDGWRYDAYLSSSWADASYTFQSFLTDRLAKSLDVVASGTGFVCRDASDGCVAAPALTSAVIGGQLPKAWSDYVFVPVTGQTQYREKVASFGIDGALFELPYGKVQTALGVEYRSNSIDDSPPADSRSGNLFNLTSAASTRGKDSVWEAYGEVEVPLLKGLPLIEELTLNASARYTSYKSYGGDYTYKIGGIYRPANWLSLRATYGTSYRAPALFEQFLGSTSGFLSATNDPCNNYDQLPTDSQRRINCASEGLPAGFLATSGIQVNSIGGAAAGLAAETSTNLTLGLVFQPKLSSSFGDFSFAVDYYRIKVDNGVSRAGAGNILALCYDDNEFRAGGSFCRLIARRDPGSNRLVVDNSYINLATDVVRGIDYTLRYKREVGPGTLRLNAAVTQYLQQASKLFADDPLDDLNKTITNPAFTGDFSVNYTYKDWRVRYGVEWIDGVSDYNFYGDNSATSVFAIKDYFLHAMSIRYQPAKWGFTLGVRNLTDREPPQISSGRYNRIGNAALYSGYDYQGRTFFLNVTKEF